MNYYYLLALLILCVLFVVSIYCMKYIRNFKLFNLIFIAAVYVPYVCLSVFLFITDTEPGRWNFLNTLPVANVSPFMFFSMPLLLFLPKKAKEYAYLLISLLAVGMFLSTGLSCVGNAVRNYRFHLHFMLDYISHFALSLFGIYLIRSKQVKFSIKNCAISSSIIYSVATLMLVLDVIFDQTFFGLSLKGRHSIYNMVLVSDSYLSALIYYLGLGGVLIAGFVLCKVSSKERFKI